MENSNIELSGFTDEQLLLHWDNDDAKNMLYMRMLPIMRKVIMPFTRTIPGYDYDDLLQEASLAFTRAVRTYNESRNASFKTYFWIYARSHMLNLAKRANRDISNETVSIYEATGDDDSGIRIIDTLSDGSDYEADAINEQAIETLRKKAKQTLSKFEYAVFYMYLDGKKALEIADALGCSRKSVANTLQRIRKKLRYNLL